MPGSTANFGWSKPAAGDLVSTGPTVIGGALDAIDTKLATDAATLVTSLAGKQPSDADLTAIAALTTTTFGRSLLTLVDAAAGRTALGLGTAATTAASAYDPAGSAAGAQAASQPADSDLTAIAALTTTAYGRAFLALADGPALRAVLGTGTADATTFLRGDGSWQVPAGGGGAPTDADYVTLTANGTLSNEKVLSTAVHMVGILADRPAAAAGNAGCYYFATDDDGGTLSRSNASSWVNQAPGITEAPALHGYSTHGPNGSDSWTKFVRKVADESVTNSTTMQDDDHLFFSVAANEIWKFWADIHYEALVGLTSNGGITMGWTVPAGTTGRWGSHSLGLAASTNTDALIVKSATLITDTLNAGGAGTADVLSLLSGMFVVGGTGGTFRLQWAQRTSSATATTVFTNSHLYAVRVA